MVIPSQHILIITLVVTMVCQHICYSSCRIPHAKVAAKPSAKLAGQQLESLFEWPVHTPLFRLKSCSQDSGTLSLFLSWWNTQKTPFGGQFVQATLLLSTCLAAYHVPLMIPWEGEGMIMLPLFP